MNNSQTAPGLGHAKQDAFAQKGYRKAIEVCFHLRNGLNVYKGKITYEAVARDLSKEYVNPETLF